MKSVSKSEERNDEGSKIGPDSETLTSNTREPVDLSFNRLSFIQSLGAEALLELRKRGI